MLWPAEVPWKHTIIHSFDHDNNTLSASLLCARHCTSILYTILTNSPTTTRSSYCWSPLQIKNLRCVEVKSQVLTGLPLGAARNWLTLHLSAVTPSSRLQWLCRIQLFSTAVFRHWPLPVMLFTPHNHASGYILLITFIKKVVGLES